jgi:hypothetical protein
MKLICAVCGKSWRRAPDRPSARNPKSCPNCRRKHQGSMMRRAWSLRKRLEAPPAAPVPEGTTPAASLDELIRDADAAAARALKLALSLAPKG